MANFSVDGHIDQGNVFIARVWFNGSVALNEGQGVCYNWNYGTATDSEPRRGNEVEVPAILNARYFAGVCAQAVTARTGGQFIEINLPGSVCNVWSGVSNTIGVGLTTCEAGTGGNGAGFFGRAGFEGRGSAVPLETVDRSSTAGLCLCRLLDGDESGLVEEVTPTAGAITLMVGGVSHVLAATLGSDATFTLADGTITGQRKGFHLVGAQTTNNLVITITSGRQNISGDTAYATWTADTAAEELFMEWLGESADGLWVELLTIGGTIA